MGRIFFLLLLIIQSGNAFGATGGSGKKQILFLSFANQTGDTNYDWLKMSLRNAVEASMTKLYSFRTVKDVDAGALVADANEPADIDTTTISSLGLKQNADGVIYGRFWIDGDYLRIEGNIYNVNSSQIIEESQVDTPLDSTLFDTVQKVAADLADNVSELFARRFESALWRGLVLPGWGQYYQQRYDNGYYIGGAFLVSALATGYFALRWADATDELNTYRGSAQTTAEGEIYYRDLNGTKKQFTAREEDVDNFRSLTYAGLGLVASVYLYSLLDLYIFRPPSPLKARLNQGPPAGLSWNAGTDGESLFVHGGYRWHF